MSKHLSHLKHLKHLSYTSLGGTVSAMAVAGTFAYFSLGSGSPSAEPREK
jgi:hypothetical protein